jgi:hypothetical protein
MQMLQPTQEMSTQHNATNINSATADNSLPCIPPFHGAVHLHFVLAFPNPSGFHKNENDMPGHLDFSDTINQCFAMICCPTTLVCRH